MQLPAVDRALEILRGRILTGELAGGERLAEVELASELGMSRTPVRQALLRLAAEGLVEVTPRRGARVIVRSEQELEHVFALRSRLEGLAARQSATLATAEEIEVLDQLAHDIGKAVRMRDMPTVTTLNSQFHGMLIEIADSATLGTAVAGLMHASVMARTQDSFDDAAHERSIAHHIEIVAAIRARDGEWAESVMHSHLLSARASLLGPRPHRGEETP